jgi:hypothetical protein
MDAGERAAAALEEERKIMAAYGETARTYSQLSLGALVLSVTFYEKVLGRAERMSSEPLLLLAWLAWLAAAVAGALHQYLAVRFLEVKGEELGVLARRGHRPALRGLARHPWTVYGTMLGCFALGSVAFLLVGALRLLR